MVTSKKSGTFSCDSDCPNWTGLGICSHSVAVAELCGKLPQQVSAFKQTKKAPSLTQFAAATIPRGRGRKGGEVPRKKKPTVQVESRIPNPSMTETETFSSYCQLNSLKVQAQPSYHTHFNNLLRILQLFKQHQGFLYFAKVSSQIYHITLCRQMLL